MGVGIIPLAVIFVLSVFLQMSVFLEERRESLRVRKKKSFEYCLVRRVIAKDQLYVVAEALLITELIHIS